MWCPAFQSLGYNYFLGENVLAAGTRAGTSASSILGLLSSADETRRKGLADLGVRTDAYHQQQGYLSGMLKQQAAYQRADQ